MKKRYCLLSFENVNNRKLAFNDILVCRMPVNECPKTFIRGQLPFYKRTVCYVSDYSTCPVMESDCISHEDIINLILSRLIFIILSIFVISYFILIFWGIIHNEVLVDLHSNKMLLIQYVWFLNSIYDIHRF